MVRRKAAALASLVLGVGLISQQARAQEAVRPDSVAAISKAGMDPERLARIPVRMKEFVQEGRIAGAVMLVARHGEVALLEAVGYQDLESKKPMRTDTIFQIRSMGKSIIAVGIMILVEEGRLTLTDPVEKHLPEFRGQMMVDRREGDKVLTLKKPSRPITIRDLLTHTSGMQAEGSYQEPLKGWVEQYGKGEKSLAEIVSIFAQQPLEFEPGTKYLYTTAGFSTLARISEVVSGQAYKDFVEQRIYRPLGMNDTSSHQPPEKRHRLASVYNLENGTLKKSGQDPSRRRISSTAMDMFAFYQMMLNGGNYKGVRILSRPSVEAMTSLHTGDLDTGRAFRGYGLGWMIFHATLGSLELQSPGAYGHGGHLGTFGWVDPKKDLVAIFLIQRHFGLKSGHGPERTAFAAMANAAVLE